MWMKRSVSLLATVSLLSVAQVLCAAGVAAQSGSATPTGTTSPSTGGITGRVTSSRSANSAAGSVVELRETGAKAIATPDGDYAFNDVRPGDYTLVVTSPGGLTAQGRVTVTAGQEARKDVALGSAPTALQELVVLAQRTPASVARRAQFEAPNVIIVQTYQEIRKLPDISAAEAVRRVPGVSLETDEGEGRYVNIRGLDADLNSTTFGGLRLPPTNNASPFGGYRAVTLDSIPIGLVGALTVTKTNLPSQDAEALGGTIEITPKTAPADGRPFLQGEVGTGYEPLRSTYIGNVNITAGTHFGGPDGVFSKGPFSILVTGAYNEDSRGFDDVEMGYFNDPAGPGARPYGALNNIDQRDYELNRVRSAYGVTLGYDPNDNSSYYFRAFDAGYSEKYLRPHLNISPDGNVTQLPDGRLQDTLTGIPAGSPAGTAPNSAIVKQLRDEYETSRDRVFTAGGRNTFGENGANTIDYRVGYTEGTYKKSYDQNSTFSLDPALAANSVITYSPTGPDHVPVYTITGAPYTDPKGFSLTGFSNSTAYNYDREVSFAADYTRLVDLFGSQDGSFKVGVDIRLRQKRTTAQPRSYLNLPANPPGLVDYASSGNESYYNGLYQNGVDITPGKLQSLFGPGTIEDGDRISAAQQFLDAHEDIYAGYGQYQATWGKFSALAGVRVENTRDRTRAFGTTFDPATNLTTVDPVSARADYTNAFPSAQLKYEIQPDLIARATYSSTIARPGFNQSSVALAVDLGSGTITQGNPNLKPATANSFDLSIEKYLPGAGIVSVGLFYKDFSNYIVPRIFLNQSVPILTNYHGGTLKAITFSNSGSSYARGVEVNFDHRFKELPGLFSGLGFAFNFTYVDSQFEIRPGEFSALPSTSEFTYNGAIYYENGPVNVRLAAYSTSADLFGIGSDKTGDVYNATRTSMDLGSSYAIRKNLVAYFNAKNLLNTPHAFYQGTPDRPIQREFYDETYQLGLRFEF